MDGQYDRKKLAALFVTLLLCGVSVLYADRDGERVATESPEQNEPPAVLGRRGIRGADILVAEEDIRNPFTPLHETAAEDSQAGAVAKDKKLPTGTAQVETTTSMAACPERPKLQDLTREPVRPVEPELCGIMQGSDGKMALLRFDGQTAVLSVGETFRDWQLVHIGDGVVMLRKDWQDKCLYLRSY